MKFSAPSFYTKQLHKLHFFLWLQFCKWKKVIDLCHDYKSMHLVIYILHSKVTVIRIINVLLNPLIRVWKVYLHQLVYSISLNISLSYPVVMLYFRYLTISTIIFSIVHTWSEGSYNGALWSVSTLFENSEL